MAFEVELIQQKREDYLAAQERAAKANGPTTPKTIAVAQLERAVVRGVASVDDYRRRLESEHYDGADVALMVQLAADERDDYRRAQAKRDAAAADLGARGLSLAQQEKAVRQNLITLDQYQAWLQSQGFRPEDAALLRASLARDIQDAADAAAVRARVNADAAAKGVTLATLERAVKLGVRTRADYAAKLVALGVSVDDQVTLLGILDAEVAQADAARRKRDEPAPKPAPAGATRADMERAVRAGLLPVDAYRTWLVAAGYSADDVDLLIGLVLVELQDVQQARQRRDAIDASNPARALARADMERAVKKGIRTIDDYAIFVAGQGYAEDDQQLLVDLLQKELDAVKTAQARHDALIEPLAAKGVDLAALDAAVLEGTATLDAYVSQLVAAGVKADDVGLCVQLLIQQQPQG